MASTTMASTTMAAPTTTTSTITGPQTTMTTTPPPLNTSTTREADMKQIMMSMGWTDGTFIPIANEENKELMKLMQALLEHKEKSLSTHQQTKQRVTSLDERQQRAIADIAQNGRLLEAHRSQMSDEHHMFKVSEHTDQILIKRLKELGNTVTELKTHDKMTNDELKRTNGGIAKLSNKIHWARDALAEWRGAMERGDQTNEMIKHYCKQDRKHAEHLEQKRQQLQSDTIMKQAALVATKEEQRSLECILDRTGQLYRQAHQERRHLVETWKDTVLALRAREAEIARNEKSIETLLHLSAKKNQQLKEELEFFNQQVQNNRESEQDIAEQNAKVTQVRAQLTAIIDEGKLLKNDSVTLKKLVQSMTAHLQQKRYRNRQASIELTEKTAHHEELTARLQKIRTKYETFRNKNFNAQDRLRHLDDLVEGEEKQLNTIAAESTRLNSTLYRTSQLALKGKNDHIVLETQIIGLETEIAAERSSFKQLDRELLRQTEIVYNVDYKLTVYESRLARMKGAGVITNPELEMKIAVQTDECEVKRRTHEVVKKQTLRVEDDMRLLTNNIALATIELEQLQYKLDFQRLELEGGQKELASTTLQNQEQLVEQSMLMLRVHEMDKMLKQQRNKVFNLQRHQNDLQLAMNERLVEVKTRREMMQQSLKHCLEELTQLRADIAERTLKIAAVQARFENALQRLGHNDDGTFVTATQIKIETAQEKQMLLREGNELNERVLRAERDIKALENTLVLVNYANEAYKKTLEPVTEDNKEMIELTRVTQRYATCKAQIKAAKNAQADQVRSLQDLQRTQQQLESDLEQINKVRMENNDTMVRLHKEILEQKSKLDRAARELKLARKTARAKVSSCVDAASGTFFASFERQLKVRELDGRNNAVLQQLADMMDEIVGMAPVVTKQLFEKGLVVPQRSASGMAGVARSCSNTSVRSAASSSLSETDILNLPPMGDSASSSGSSRYTSHRSYGCATPATSCPLSVVNGFAGGPAIVTLDFDANGGGGGGSQRGGAKKK